MVNRIIIKELRKQKSTLRNLFSLLFTVDGGNDYIMVLGNDNNVLKEFGGIALANGETEKTLLRKLESYVSLNAEKICNEIIDILDEWEIVVENIDGIEKMVNDYVKRQNTEI